MAEAGDRSRSPGHTVALLSWSFLFWAPPKCLPLFRQRAGGDRSSDDRPERKAGVGRSEGKMTIKLGRGNHVQAALSLSACAFAGTMLRTLSSSTSRSRSARYASSGRPSELAAAVERLLPGRTGKKVLPELRSFAGLKGWRGASCHGAHPFRRGAAVLPPSSIGPLALIRLSALSVLGREESSATASIMVEASEGE